MSMAYSDFKLSYLDNLLFWKSLILDHCNHKLYDSTCFAKEKLHYPLTYAVEIPFHNMNIRSQGSKMIVLFFTRQVSSTNDMLHFIRHEHF